ncbi:hypothetical protein O3M35_010460 [Rhynocoris fuscipes]|uniref:Uncharacterized protein n=1 Tax=Rhynocoris fuscipes TaxID=488301 RepID=A0AAW1CZY0_9HEMI
MAPSFWLEITDWKKENTLRSLESLKYFDNEADLDIKKINSKINFFLKKIPFIYYDAFKLFSNFIKSYDCDDNEILSSRSVISRIMNTPFEINRGRRKWIIKAKLFKNNAIYLYYDREEEEYLSEDIAKQYEILKRYLFVKYPVNYYRNETSVFDEIFGRIAFIDLEIGKLYYTTEISGVISDSKITNIDELNEATYIYCDIFEDGKFSQDVINYNPIWWSKAKLTNAEQFIIASYDKHNNCLKKILKFNMNEFEDKRRYENLWSPDAAWNFLNNFIQFVRNSVNCVSDEIKNKCIWKYESFQDKRPFVTCEILFNVSENGDEVLIPLMFDEAHFP